MWRSKTVALFSALSLLAATPAVPETSREAAEVVAARNARTCYVEMLDGQIKCGGRPRRTFAEARALLGPGTLAKADEPGPCHVAKPIWMFRWRGFPDQAPIAVDAETGKLTTCRP
jgi:hypothetical protein